MRSSRAAVDLIVAHEVTSKDVYEKKYQRPEWPGVQSGLTVGIGYDLGYNTAATILNDWKDYLEPNVVRAMQSYAGLTGDNAKAKLAEARSKISVPWDAAMAVFMQTSLPKFEALVLKYCPGSEKLPAGCFGVLSSLTYNRGASFTKAGDRYLEMRNIRAYVVTGEWDKVPAELRHMKRLWPAVPGLKRRRDEEADLWEKSLKAAPPPLPEPDPRRVDTGDERDPLPEEVTTNDVDDTDEETKVNVQPSHAKYSLEVQLIQKALISMKYFEVGEPDGKIGGKFIAGVAAFMTDRGKDPNKGKITDDLKNEINKAMTEKLADGSPWSRPIAPTRANATAKDIAPTVASVTPTWYAKIMAFIVAIPSAVTGMIKSFFGDKDPPSEYIAPIKEFFGAIPSEVYWFAVAALAVGIFLAVKKAQDATVKDYQQGKIN